MDDSIEMAKLLKKKNIQHELLVIDNGCTHGFLNMRNLCEETREASNQAFRVLERILNNYQTQLIDI